MGTKSDRWIIGLTGRNAAGKGEVAAFLENHAYHYRSLSDILREEATKRGLESSRDVLIRLGRELREQGGPGVLAQMTLPLLTDDRYVIDSVRHPAEVDFLQPAGHFVLIGVDAPVELRYERAMKRGRTENATSLEDFIKTENRERSNDPRAQQLDQTWDRVDETVLNTGTRDELGTKVAAILGRRGFPC